MATQESRLAIVIDTKGSESKLGKLRKLLLGVDSSSDKAAASADHLSDELGTLGGSSSKASKGLSSLDKDMRKASNSTSKLDKAMDKLGLSLGNLKGLLGGVFAGIGISSLTNTADAMKNLDSQVRLVTNGIAEFNTVQSELRRIANDQYSDISSLTQLYTSSRRALEQLGKTQQDTLQFTNNLAMAMRVGGGEAQAQAAALTQLGQALASGVLRGDEFNSIAEQAPILLRLVSKEMGVTQGALRELAADGAITSEIVYRSVANATKDLEAMASQMPTTIGQAVTVARNKYQAFVGDILNNSTGITAAIASGIGILTDNFESLATILTASAAAWGAYTLATSTFATSTIPSLITGLATSIKSIYAQSAAMQTSIANTFSLSAMQDVLSASTYRLQKARVVGRLALLNYKLATLEALAATKAKTASVLGAIAVQARYAAAVATSGNLLSILSLKLGGAIANFRAKVGAVAAAIRANTIYAASMVSTHGVMGATALGVRSLTKAITAKTGAMIAAARQTSIYSLAIKGLGGTAKIAGRSVLGLTSVFTRLGAVILAHPIMAISATLFTVIAATEGLEAAMDSLSDAIKVVGILFADFVKVSIKWIKSLADTFSSWISGFIKSSEQGVNESSSMFAWMFDTTAGGFVGLLQVIANVFDGAAKVVGTFVITAGKGIYNLGVSIKNNAAAMVNALIEAFNSAGSVIANILNGIARNTNKVIGLLNKIPKVNIPTWKDDFKFQIGKRFQSTEKLDNSWQGNWDAVSSVVDSRGARSLVDSAIARMQESKKASADLTDGMGDLANAISGAGDAADKAGKKGKKAGKDAKDGLSDAEKAAQKLAEAFDKTKSNLERTLALIGNETLTAEWIYDLADPMHELYNLSNQAKDEIIALAASIDKSKLNYDLQTNKADLQYEMKMIKAKNDLQREELKIRQKAEKLLAKYNVFQKEGFNDLYKRIKLSIEENMQLETKVARLRDAARVNKELTDATEQLNKQIFLFGNDSQLDAFIYDLEQTEKYANASKEAVEDLRAAYERLQALEAGKAFDSLLGGFNGDDTNPIAKLVADYEDKLEVIRNYELAHTDLLKENLEERQKVEKAYNMARRELIFEGGEAISGGLSDILGNMIGKQSKAYRTLFAIEKGFVVALAALKAKEAMARAMGAATPMERAIAIGEAVTQGAKIASAIQEVVMPIGQAHDGIMRVPESGTWNLKEGERVLPEKTAKKMDRELEKGGRDIIINNYTNEKAEVSRDAQGNDVITIGKIINQAIDQKLSNWERKALRQGGALAR